MQLRIDLKESQPVLLIMNENQHKLYSNN